MQQSASWKLLGSQLVNFILWNILWNPEVHYLIQKKSLSWARWVSSMLPHSDYFKMHRRIFLPHPLGSLTYSQSFRFPHLSRYVPRAQPISSFSILLLYFKTEPRASKFTPKFSVVPGQQTVWNENKFGQNSNEQKVSVFLTKNVYR